MSEYKTHLPSCTGKVRHVHGTTFVPLLLKHLSLHITFPLAAVKMQWLKITQIYSLTVLEAKSLKLVLQG